MASYDIIVKAVDGTRAAFNSIDRSLTGLAKNAKAAQKSIDDMTGGLQKAGAVASAALALGARSAIMFTSKVNDANSATGIAREKILALGQALAVNGGDANKASQAMVEFNERLGAARLGAGEQANALYALGVSYKDLNSLSPEQLFDRVVTALSGVTDQSEAAKLATALFADTMKGVNVNGIAGDYGKLVGKQKEAAEATKSIGQASDSLNQAWVRVQLSIAKALKPAADFINKLSPERLDALIGSVGKLAVAIAGLSAGLKVFSLVASGIGALAAYWTLFGKGASMASTGVKMAGTAISSLGKTAAITFGVLKNYAAPAIWNALKAGSGIFAEIGITIATLGKRLSFALSAVGGLGGAVKMLLGGFLRMVPLIGTITTLAWGLNEVIKLMFGVDIIDEFVKKFKEAWDNIVKYASDKWNAFKGIFGMGQQAAAALPPTGAGAGRGSVNPAAVDPNAPGPVVKLNRFIEELDRSFETAQKDYLDLMAAMSQTKDLNMLAALFSKLTSVADQFGEVLKKPARLIQRDYAIAVEKASEELRQHEIELANTATTTKKWENELQATNLQIYEQSLKLGDAAYMQKVFNQEIAQTNNNLREQEKRLANAEYQSDKFIQMMQQTSIDTRQQQITLALLNAEYAKGQMPLETYVKLLGGIDTALLGTNEKFAQFRQELSNGEKAWGDNFAIANKTWQLYQDGKLTLKELELAVSQLGEEYFNWNALLKVHVTQANDAVAADDKHKFMLEQLTEQFKKGAVAADVYRKAAGNLGMSQEEADRMVNVYGKATDKMRENNDFLRESIKGAATTFSKEFTDAFVNMKNPLSAFKNMFTNILNDIATRIVKQKVADPLADTMIKAMEGIMGVGGSTSTGSGGVAQIMTDGATQGGEGMLDAVKSYGTKIMESMGGLGQGITNMFSGMGDSLMSIFGDVFNWISSNAGSLGNSLSGLLGSVGGMFGGGGGDFFGGIGEFFAGFFADGGTIPSGQFGIVGEAGPEFVTGPASVTPMNVDQVNSDSNGGLTVNFQLYAIDTQSGVQFLLQNKPAIISMVGEAYNKRGRRGPLD